MKKNIIAGLDLGTTKVCAVIAEKGENNRIDILRVRRGSFRRSA
jgi:cell division ATPase FtsA